MFPYVFIPASRLVLRPTGLPMAVGARGERRQRRVDCWILPTIQAILVSLCVCHLTVYVINCSPLCLCCLAVYSTVSRKKMQILNEIWTNRRAKRSWSARFPSIMRLNKWTWMHFPYCEKFPLHITVLRNTSKNVYSYNSKSDEGGLPYHIKIFKYSTKVIWGL